MSMIQRKFYLPEDMYTRLQFLAKATKQTITETLRELVQEGLERKQKQRAGQSAKALLELAKKAEREGWTGPNDLSINHDAYFVEAWEEQDKRKRHDTV